jgi:hypothetical protein
MLTVSSFLTHSFFEAVSFISIKLGHAPIRFSLLEGVSLDPWTLVYLQQPQEFFCTAQVILFAIALL